QRDSARYLSRPSPRGRMMMKTNILSRRLFLGSAAGVTVSLPLLEGFGPRSAKAQAEDAFRYAIFLRQGNGVVQGSFWPSQAGTLTTQSMEADAANGDKAVSVLSPYASKLNIIHGIGYRYSGSGCGHADGCFQCLTASTKNGNFSNQTLAMGESIDWRISRDLDPSGVEPVSLY